MGSVEKEGMKLYDRWGSFEEERVKGFKSPWRTVAHMGPIFLYSL